MAILSCIDAQMMYRQRTFAVKIAIGKTADLIRSSARMNVASRWERKAFAAQNLELLFCLSTASLPKHRRNQEPWHSRQRGAEPTHKVFMTLSQDAINVIAGLFFSFSFCTEAHAAISYLLSTVSRMRWCLYGKCCKNISILQNKLQIKHIHKKNY